MTADMKFTDALRLADQMELPNLRNAFWQPVFRDWHGEKPPCCAIGGANIASGRTRVVPAPGVTGIAACVGESVASLSWGEIPEVLATCPACRESLEAEAWSWIVHLYDWHHWSRTQIADWLDSVEPTP